MKYLSILIFILAIGCSVPKSDVVTQTPRPNIVLIVGDDQGYPYFGFMGADYVQTPNMDQLATSGIVFTDAYVPDNHCRPSLQSLMTGTLPIQYAREAERIKTQLKLNEDFQQKSEEEQNVWDLDFQFHAMQYFNTLPKILEKNGYISFQGGKWWEFNYQNGGFTHGMTAGWTPKDRENGGKWFKQFMGGTGLELARKTMQPAYDFIDQAGDQPFFLWFAPELPHYPFDAPDKYYNIYKDRDMTESAKRYYANCTWFDEGVGELMQYLNIKEKLDNTLFVYVNDNGWEQAPDQEFRHDSLRWHNGGDKGKLSMYDMSFRTPVIFSWKGKIKSGERTDALMHSTDIPATILDYLQIDIPTDYFGKTFKPVIEGTRAGLRDEIIGNISQTRWEGDMMGRKLEGYWVRNKNWFYSYNATDSVHSLFDMNNDATNDNNLASQYSDQTTKFFERIKAWKEEMGK